MVTQDQRCWLATLSALEQEHISYREKQQNMGNESRRGGQLSGLGESHQNRTLYQVFVRSEDLEEAQYIIRILREQNRG